MNVLPVQNPKYPTLLKENAKKSLKAIAKTEPTLYKNLVKILTVQLKLLKKYVLIKGTILKLKIFLK